MERTPRAGLGNAVGEVASSSKFPKRQRSSQQRPVTDEAVPGFDFFESFMEEEEDNSQRQAHAQETIATDNCGKGNKSADPVENGNNGPVSVTLNDPEVLDCPICNEALTIPVFQCRIGHIVCNRCCFGLMNKCPSCRLPIGRLRCTAMEKVLESVQVTCENANYGCKEKMSYSKKYDHGMACHHAPCDCPITACIFSGSFNQMYQHFRGVHKDAAEEFVYDKVLHITLSVHHDLIFLQEKWGGYLFILSNITETHGHRISLNRIAPLSKGGVVYSIAAKSGGTAYEFNSCTKSIRKWDKGNSPPVVSLLVPSDFFGSNGQLKLEILIQRPKK